MGFYNVDFLIRNSYTLISKALYKIIYRVAITPITTSYKNYFHCLYASIYIKYFSLMPNEV